MLRSRSEVDAVCRELCLQTEECSWTVAGMVVSQEQSLLLRMLLRAGSARPVVAVACGRGIARDRPSVQGRNGACRGNEVQLCPAMDTLRAMPDIEPKLLTQRHVWAHPSFNLRSVVIEGGAGGPLALQS